MNLEENPVVFVTRDSERAQGMPEGKGYSVISSDGEYDTYELLQDPKILEKIKEKKASVLVFKNTTQIEELAKQNGIKLLNPSASLSEKIENKITQIEWLGELSRLLPPHKVTLVKNIVWEKKPFIVQWAHSHTGDGTLLIQKESDLAEIKAKFPEREARATEFIKGPMFTANIVATGSELLLGNISYQITGVLPFTDNPFSTIGNDWSVPYSILTDAHVEYFNTIATLVGSKIQSEGWKGLFGIDVIYDEERDQLYLIEINARQPASTTYESQLQEKLRKEGVSGITVFEAHLSALSGIPITKTLVQMNDGSQIIQRVTRKVQGNIDTKKLEDAGYNVIKYKNTKLNLDLLRIQCVQGIMETHNKFNKRGKEIVELLTTL